jgi:hypothetical protein
MYSAVFELGFSLGLVGFNLPIIEIVYIEHRPASRQPFEKCVSKLLPKTKIGVEAGRWGSSNPLDGENEPRCAQ